MNNDNGIGIVQARTFLAEYYRIGSAKHLEVELVGEGAWSRCFGYRHGDHELVIRFGNYVDDFQNDQLAYRYATPDLLISEVFDIGEAFDGFYAISTCVHGVPLESIDAT